MPLLRCRPAAGLGTRVLPATKAMPKGMLTIVDKPAIQYLVEEAVRSGITDILIILGRTLVRDMFLFQCFVGCRIGDLFTIQRTQINNGWLEYITGKNLKNNKTELVRIPCLLYTSSFLVHFCFLFVSQYRLLFIPLQQKTSQEKI